MTWCASSNWSVAEAGTQFQPQGPWGRGGIRHSDVAAAAASSVVYIVTGVNARVNIDSTDASANVVNLAPAELFETLRRTIEEHFRSGDDKRNQLLEIRTTWGRTTWGRSFCSLFLQRHRFVRNSK
jgi:hypothetical protein